MITILSSFLSTFFNKFKIYFSLAFILFLAYFMFQNQSLKTNLKNTASKLDEANKNFDLTVAAYESTLKVEKQIAEQKAITQEQKEVVVTKYKTLTKTIEKRGEIKQDEKSNFTIVTF